MNGMGSGYVLRKIYELVNCIKHCVRGDFFEYYFKAFSFLLIWDENLRSHIV